MARRRDLESFFSGYLVSSHEESRGGLLLKSCSSVLCEENTRFVGNGCRGMAVRGLPLFAGHYTAKAKMIGARADFTFASSTHDVARTILVRAQIRAAAVNLFRFAGLRRIKGCSGSLRIAS